MFRLFVYELQTQLERLQETLKKWEELKTIEEATYPAAIVLPGKSKAILGRVTFYDDDTVTFHNHQLVINRAEIREWIHKDEILIKKGDEIALVKILIG